MKWLGQCPACKEWNTFVEETVPVQTAKNTAAGSRGTQAPVTLNQVSMGEEEKVHTHIKELDRVLGGGIVPGSLTLVGGDPGIGKSTLLLQVCRNLSEDGHPVLYISGEESLKQIKMRANRMGDFSDQSGADRGNDPKVPAGICGHRFHTDHVQRRNICGAGKRFAGAGVYGDFTAACEGPGDFRFYCGTCDKRRNGSRPQSFGTYGGYGALF